MTSVLEPWRARVGADDLPLEIVWPSSTRAIVGIGAKNDEETPLVALEFL